MGDVELKINEDMIKSIIESKMQAAIISALSQDPQRIIEGIVTTALNQKVDSAGLVSRSSYENKYNWVEMMVQKAIRDVSQGVVTAWIEKEKPAIEKAIMKELGKQKEPMAKAFVASFVSQARNSYGFKVEIKPRPES